MVGGIVLRECLASSEIAKVTSITRRASGVVHEKLNEIVLQDFLDYSSISEQFNDQDAVYYCQGVYTGQVPDDQFKLITYDYVKAFADMLKEQSPEATFCLLSGAGADQTEQSRMSFAKYKGMAENHLISKEFHKLYIFRPAYIYPVEKRKAPNFMYSFSRAIYPLFKAVYPKGVITSEQLGKAIFKAGLNGARKMILENQDIKEV